MKKFIYVLIVAGIVAGLVVSAGAEASVDCKDVQFVFARGSGTAYGENDMWRSLQTEVSAQMAGVGVSYGVYEVNYPAVGINAWNILPTWISAGRVFEFGDSVSDGAVDVVGFYKEQVSRCAQTKFVLMGYSQGAKVIANALEVLDPEAILYVAMFGDPNLYLPEGAGVRPPACRGEGLSKYRVYVPDCNTENGVLGARKPYEISGYEGKLGLWCNEKDLVCGSSRNLLVNSGHSKYETQGHVGSAVRQAILRIKRDILGQVVDLSMGRQAPMDTVILIDSTGSMASYVAKYRAEAVRLAKLAIESGGRVALYEYGDLNDPFGLGQLYGYVDIDPDDLFGLRQLCDFSCSLSEFEQKIDAIGAGGGGDGPKSLLNAALGVMNKLEWQKGATKSIVMLTDATYVSPDRNGTTLAQVVRRSLEIDPVNIYVVTNEDIKGAHIELTELTGGKVFGVGEMSASTDYIVSRPVAMLPFERYYGGVGEQFYFDASESYGVGADLSHFEWDLDGDGVFEVVTMESFVGVEFDVEGERFVVVKVVAEDGSFSTMSAIVTVGDGAVDVGGLAPVDLSAEKMSETQAVLSWTPTSEVVYVLVAVNGVPLGYMSARTGEVRIDDLDLSQDVQFVATGMDAELNLGESAYAFLKANGDAEETVLTEVKDDGLGIGEEVHIHSLVGKLAVVEELRLPSTGGKMMANGSVLSSRVPLMIVSVVVGLCFMLWRYKTISVQRSDRRP